MKATMIELKITDDHERSLVLSALISHAYKCRDIINLHNETKDALKENAMVLTAEKAKNEMHEALTMIAKYYGLHLGNSKFYCLNCAPSEGEEHDRMSQAEFAWWNDCSKCGNGAYYFVEPKL
jgi:hypothetical protein